MNPIATWSIPFVPKSPNELRGKSWILAWKQSRDWRTVDAAVCGRPKNPCKDRRRLEITTHRKRRLDPDNAVASIKPVLDALTNAGWIRDDSAKWLELEVRQEVGLHQTGIVLREIK